MLKLRIKWIIVLLSTAITAFIISIYLLLQHQIGCQFISKHLSNERYSIEIGALSHSLTSPTTLTLKAVHIIEKKTGRSILQSNDILLGFTPKRLWKTGNWDFISIKNGKIDIDLTTQSHTTITSKQLQLHNTTISVRSAQRHLINGLNINGSITPWTKSTQSNNHVTRFEFTAQQIKIANTLIEQIAISGFHTNNTLYISNFGGNSNNGFFIGQAKRLHDKSWQIDELQINHFNIENTALLNLLTENSKILPKITINSVNVTDSSVNLPRLKVEKANLEINNLVYPKDLSTKKMTIAFDAQHICWNDELFTAPEVRLDVEPNNLILTTANSRWRKGLLSFKGQWHNGDVILDKLKLSGIHYVLPIDWLNTLHQTKLPEFLSNVTIKNLTLTPSLIIDTNSAFPMQFSDLEAKGQNVVLVKNNQFVLQPSNIRLNAKDAAINGILLKYPELTSHLSTHRPNQLDNINSEQLTMAFNTLIDKGILDGSLQANVNKNKIDHITFNGNTVDMQILKFWHVIMNPPTGDQFFLNLFGSYNPLNLNGEMIIKELNKQQQYQVTNNRIIQPND